MRRTLTFLCFLGALQAGAAHAGAQRYELMSASVRATMAQALNEPGAPLSFRPDAAWLGRMSAALKRKLPDDFVREHLLTDIYYEASRAGLDPMLVVGLIDVESGFRKYAISGVSARGYMQVMPFWTRTIGSARDDLFAAHTNLRYGCTILRHYLDQEHGNLFRALGRYNGSLGQAQYPNLVLGAWKRYLRVAGEPATPRSPLLQASSAPRP